MKDFQFLRAEWPDVHEAAAKAGNAVYPDPRTACFYARRALELAVSWVFKYDAVAPSAVSGQPERAHSRADASRPPPARRSSTRLGSSTTLGNQAVHSHRPVRQFDALTASRTVPCRATGWRAPTRAARSPTPALAFDASRVCPRPAAVSEADRRLTADGSKQELRERDEKLSVLLADRTTLDEELKRLRAEVAAAKKANAAQPDTHDYSEARDPRLFHRPAAEGGGLGTRPAAATANTKSRGMPNAQRQGLRGLRAVG